MAKKSEVSRDKLGVFHAYFQSKLPAIRAMLPKHMTPERVGRIAIGAISRNPSLLECTPETVWKCVAEAACVGLEVGVLGAAHLVPFRNSKTNSVDCQLIIGYQGLIDLCRRSGHIEIIEAHVIYANDEYDINYGTKTPIIHRPTLKGDPGEMVCVYAMAWFVCGGHQLEVMTKAEIDKIKSRSKASTNGPWKTDYEEMARKTVVRRLTKYLPKSIEMARALDAEDSTAGGDYDFGEIKMKDITPEPDEKTKTERLKEDIAKREEPAVADGCPEYLDVISILKNGGQKADAISSGLIDAGLESVDDLDSNDDALCSQLLELANTTRDS